MEHHLVRIGSRGSLLALWQAEHIAGLLRGQRHEVEIEVIKTTGDRLQEVTFAQVGSKGMFTKEIEDALAAGRVDLAVHSLKDLPTELPEGFTLGATPKRVDPRDVFVSREYVSFDELPAGAKVGTSSLRRRAQLRHRRPELEFVEFRGNVDTRLRKLAEGRADAIILAAAGLDRLEKTEWVRERLEPEVICPAAGQGALGIEIRAGDARMVDVVAFLDDATTRFAVTAERVALAGLGGGCQVPVGVHCRAVAALPTSQNQDVGHPTGGVFEILGVVADPEGGRVVRSLMLGEDAEKLGQRLAEHLLELGAAELIDGVGVR